MCTVYVQYTGFTLYPSLLIPPRMYCIQVSLDNRHVIDHAVVYAL